MKQTTVQWFASKVMTLNISPKEMHDFINWYEEAKQMEKEQIKKAYLDSSRETCDSYGDDPPHDDPKFAELYYKNIYGQL
jgi:hypothetical protein